MQSSLQVCMIKIFNRIDCNSLFESYSETDFTAVMSSSTWPSNQYWVCFNDFYKLITAIQI